MTAHPAFQLDWNLVRTFTAVVKGGSLASAARHLGLAHPTVARHVQTLESSLGVALFDRTTNGLCLNDAGERLARAAGEMRSSALAFEAASDQIRTAPDITVRVTVAELLAEALPGLLVPPAGDNAPQLPVLELIISDDSLNLLERDADIALRHVRPRQQELVCRRLGVLPMAVFASPQYVSTHGEPTEATLHEQSLVDGVSHQRFVEGGQKRGLPLDHSQIAFRTDSLACQARAVVAGWGIACLPLHVTALHPQLMRVLPDLIPAEIEVWIVARPEVRMNDSLKLAFDQVANNVTTILG